MGEGNTPRATTTLDQFADDHGVSRTQVHKFWRRGWLGQPIEGTGAAGWGKRFVVSDLVAKLAETPLRQAEWRRGKARKGAAAKQHAIQLHCRTIADQRKVIANLRETVKRLRGARRPGRVEIDHSATKLTPPIRRHIDTLLLALKEHFELDTHHPDPKRAAVDFLTAFAATTIELPSSLHLNLWRNQSLYLKAVARAQHGDAERHARSFFELTDQDAILARKRGNAQRAAPPHAARAARAGTA